jgi:hypothetical protein
MKGKLSIVLIVVVFFMQQVNASQPFVSSVGAAGPSMTDVVQLVQNGQSSLALQLVVDAALQMGGWGPAPGDNVVYDPSLAWTVRAEVMVRDAPPGECAMAKVARLTEECGLDLVSQQNLVRFGPSMFLNPQPEGDALPRPAFDDLLSTYIEEVGHSWQEYFFETDGLGSGPRTHMTGWEEASQWSYGWEYQVKVYVLYLDGKLLSLSDAERDALTGNICKDEGYANPLGHHVPSDGPPPGWPYPEGWPVSDPTPDELQAFCS